MRRPTGLLALILLVTPVAEAAGPSILPSAAPAAATAGTPSGPEPIATADIPLRADVDERYAEEVIGRSNGRDPSQRLQAELAHL